MRRSGHLRTVGCLTILLACCRTEEHRIPAQAQGDVYILTGYRDGVAPKREGGKTVFEIPRSRILVTQDVPTDGWYDITFFYVDESGKRVKVDYEPSTIERTAENLADRRPIAWFVRTGEIRSADLPCPIRFMRYYVGSRANLLSRTVDEANEQELRVEAYVRERKICP